MSFALGLDLGGSTGRAAIVDKNSGQLVASEKVHWKARTLEEVVQSTAALALPLIQKYAPQQPVIGVGLAAMVRGPSVINAPNLGWYGVDVGTPLAAALGRPVRLMNDLSAAAWGEYCAGAARGARHSLTVFVGTGVGSAIIADGALIAGATQVAGELGHIKIVAQGGRRCGCGQDGCLEAYAGGAKLQEWMHEEGLEGTASQLEALAERENPRAQKLYDFVVSQLGLAIANQVTMMNPEVVVLGGGVLNHSPKMVTHLRRTIEERSTAAATESLRVVLAALGDDAGLVGAAFLP